MPVIPWWRTCTILIIPAIWDWVAMPPNNGSPPIPTFDLVMFNTGHPGNPPWCWNVWYRHRNQIWILPTNIGGFLAILEETRRVPPVIWRNFYPTRHTLWSRSPLVRHPVFLSNKEIGFVWNRPNCNPRCNNNNHHNHNLSPNHPWNIFYCRACCIDICNSMANWHLVTVGFGPGTPKDRNGGIFWTLPRVPWHWHETSWDWRPECPQSSHETHTH
mmetsp:Transcript_18818/g.38977  ORF Transcript_18818/g.38977 Transcript_18818/m.38977 type:complete len:216 (-) Transcript_18818:450-1097(-)